MECMCAGAVMLALNPHIAPEHRLSNFPNVEASMENGHYHLPHQLLEGPTFARSVGSPCSQCIIDRYDDGLPLHLDKFNCFEGQLAQDSGLAVEEHMPKVMCFPISHCHICKLLIVHKSNRRPVVCMEPSLCHKVPVGSPKGTRWQRLCTPHDFVLHLQQKQSELHSLSMTPFPG